ERGDERPQPAQKRAGVADERLHFPPHPGPPQRAEEEPREDDPLQPYRRRGHEEQAGREAPGVGDDRQEPKEDTLEGGRADARPQAARPEELQAREDHEHHQRVEPRRHGVTSARGREREWKRRSPRRGTEGRAEDGAARWP